MKDAIKELLPPADDGRPLSPLTRWRIAIFAVCVSFVLFMCWALSPYGFALAGDFRDLRSNVDDMRLGQIEQQIYDSKQSECVAKMYSSERRFFANRVMELIRKYRGLSGGGAVDIPPCAQGQKDDE
jgi:hypothetical protein